MPIDDEKAYRWASSKVSGDDESLLRIKRPKDERVVNQSVLLMRDN